MISTIVLYHLWIYDEVKKKKYFVLHTRGLYTKKYIAIKTAYMINVACQEGVNYFVENLNIKFLLKMEFWLIVYEI